MADYTSTAVDVGTGPAGSDGDTTRAAFLKVQADLAQLFSVVTSDATTKDATFARHVIAAGNITGAGSINSTVDGGNALLNLTSYGAVPVVYFRRSNGTLASPTAVANADAIIRIDGRGYDGAGFDDGGGTIVSNATETWDATSHGQSVSLSSTANGATTATKGLTVEEDSGTYLKGATGGSQGSGTINTTAVHVNGTKWSVGSGTPESAVTGSIGDLFSRTDGGAGTTLYVKESGTATNTGWAGV